MEAEIIAVGTELLLGDILNTNAQYLAAQLAALGFTVHYQTVVGDNAGRLAAVLRSARQRSRLLVVCGGLGPTADDLTRQTAAAVFGDTLIEDPVELARIAAVFAALGRPMTDNNRVQALVPAHGGKFVNDNGTAPGIWLQQGDCRAVLLPGPPAELRPMFENQVRPWLQTLTRAALVSRWLYVTGIPESTLDARLAGYLAAENPTAALYAKTAEVHIRLTARAETAAGEAAAGAEDAAGAADTAVAKATAAADALAVRVAKELGAAVYGTDCEGGLPLTEDAAASGGTATPEGAAGLAETTTLDGMTTLPEGAADTTLPYATTLEAAVVAALRAAGRQVSFAESCTGGLTTQRLTAVPGASEVFCGGVVSYSEDFKQRLLGVRAETLAAHTVYSAPVAVEMARGAARLAAADLGVGITGIAGPDGGLTGIPVGTVFIALYDAKGGRHAVQRLYCPDRGRAEVRLRASQRALDMVRRAALGLAPGDDVEWEKE